MLLKIILLTVGALLFFALGWVLSSEFQIKSNISWLASPIAILLSATITLCIAWTTWNKSKDNERANRTIKFLLDNFPLPTEELENLGSAQMKIMESTQKFAKRKGNTIYFDMVSYHTVEESLKLEEKEAINKLCSIYEIISLNIENKYFDESIVKAHLGKDFGLLFWIRSWPYLIYHNNIFRIYMNAKGIGENDHEGNFYKYINRVISDERLNNKYPLYGESDSPTDNASISKVIKLV